MKNNSGVILDKSYLQGSSQSKIMDLANKHTLLCTPSLIYEIFKCEKEEKIKLLNKFPLHKYPYAVTRSFGPLMRDEIKYHVACGQPSESSRPISMHRHKHHLDIIGTLSNDEEKYLQKNREEVEEETKHFINTVEQMRSSYFPLDTKITDEKNKLRLESKIYSDRLYILDKVRKIQLDEVFFQRSKFPAIDLIDQNWAIFRFMQVYSLFIVNMSFKHLPGSLADSQGKFRERIRHDAIDLQYLVLATLEGCFACKEKKLNTWFKLLCPNGVLYE